MSRGQRCHQGRTNTLDPRGLISARSMHVRSNSFSYIHVTLAKKSPVQDEYLRAERTEICKVGACEIDLFRSHANTNDPEVYRDGRSIANRTNLLRQD